MYSNISRVSGIPRRWAGFGSCFLYCRATPARALLHFNLHFGYHCGPLMLLDLTNPILADDLPPLTDEDLSESRR